MRNTPRRRYTLTAIIALVTGFAISVFLGPADATEVNGLAKSRQKLQALRDQHLLFGKATKGAHKIVKYDSGRATMTVETNAPALMSVLFTDFGWAAGVKCKGGPARCTKCEGGSCVASCTGGAKCAHVFTPNGKGGLTKSCSDLAIDPLCTSDKFF